MPTDRVTGKTTRWRELRRGVRHHLTFLAHSPGKRRGPSGAPKERLEPKARESHAHRVGCRQKYKAVGVEERDWSPLNVFSSLSRKTKGPSRAPKERLEPKSRQSDAHQASGQQKYKAVGVEERDWSPLNVFGSLARKTKGPSGAPKERLEPKARQSHDR